MARIRYISYDITITFYLLYERPVKSKLLLIMIDGISSDYFLCYPQFMPYTHGLAKDNTVLTGLSPEMCGSSLPGRTSILTGQSSKQHGIYGNFIWDNAEKGFRYATPYDIRIPSLFELTKSHGIQTASLGYGMIKPEDCDLYEPPFWISDFVSRARDKTPIPISDDWQKALQIVDDGRLACAKDTITVATSGHNVNCHPFFDEMQQELRMNQLSNQIIASGNPPDLIFTETNITDSVQHVCGYGSDTANFSIAFADMLVGNLLHTLHRHNLDEDYTIVITSDHGHGDTEQAFYVDNITDNANWSAESAILFIENNTEVDQHIDKFSKLGTELLDHSFLPDDVSDKIITLASRQKVSYELSATNDNRVCGPSKYISSHSYYPGTQDDKRFAVISGKHCANTLIENATPEQLYNYCTEILEID